VKAICCGNLGSVMNHLAKIEIVSDWERRLPDPA
jgi:hypothetical protein